MRFADFRKVAIAFALLLFIFLFLEGQRIDFRQHDTFISNLLRVKELDALIDQDVVQARAGLITSYDTIANNFSELKKHQNNLKNIPVFINKTGKNRIQEILKLQAEILQRKEYLLERFKSENSILKNSLYYFPTLSTRLAQRAERERRNKPLANLLEILLKNVLIYNLTPSEELAPEIQGQLGLLLTTRSQYSSTINGSDIDRVILHGKIIIRNKPQVDSLVQEIVNLPTSQRSEELYRTYNQYYEKALNTVGFFRLLLSLFYIILISGVSTYIILKLRKSAETVSAAKEKLQEALEATQQAEEKFRKIFENSTDGIFQTTPEGRYLSANPTLARLYGYASPEELMTTITDIRRQLYVNRNRRAEFIDKMQSYDVISQFESQVYRKDGSIIWISENARTVKDANGVLLYYEGTVEDITERKLAEAMLLASETKLRLQQAALMELSRCQPLYTGDVSAAFREITETAGYTLGVERASVWLYNEKRSRLRCVDLYELKPNQHSAGFELSAVDYPGYFQLLKADSMIASNNAQADPTTEAFCTSYLTPLGITSILNVPIRLGGQTVGLLCHEQVGATRNWSLEEENFASYLAYMASLAMEASDRKQAQEALRLEQEKAEKLLLNILPEPIAQRLKQGHNSIADSFEEVSVLFADIVGFTQIASRISPKELVGLLNQIFSTFDQLADQHGLEKIKTIGDAYMAVTGLPMPRADHAEAIAQMALDMQQAVNKFSLTLGEPLSIRIGINSGPVVAGVIGIKKFIYDLWGDTVNIASRMESHGIPGAIQVTSATYELLQDKYLLEERGVIHIKGKGDMTTYLLIGKKE